MELRGWPSKRDLAVLIGGQMISEEVGVKLLNATIDMLGTAKRVVVTNENTTIVAGADNKADIDGRCNQILWADRGDNL